MAGVFEWQKQFIVGHLGNAYWLALGAAVTVAVLVVALVFNAILDKSRLIRRVLMGSMDMEGDWTNLAIDKNTGELVNVAFTTITFRDGHFCYDGTAWDCESGRTVYWKTLQSDYSEDRLTFRYRTWWAGSGTRPIQGSGILHFRSEYGRITCFTGEFIDIWHLRECVNIGQRVRYGWAESRRIARTSRSSARRRGLRNAS